MIIISLALTTLLLTLIKIKFYIDLNNAEFKEFVEYANEQEASESYSEKYLGYLKWDTENEYNFFQSKNFRLAGKEIHLTYAQKRKIKKVWKKKKKEDMLINPQNYDNYY